MTDPISTQIDVSRDSIKSQVGMYLKEYLELENVDLTKSSFLLFLVNILSTLTGNILFYQLSLYKEFYLTQAQLPDSIFNLSAFLGYNSSSATYATSNVTMTVDFNFPDSSNTFTIPSGFKFKSDSIEFVTYYNSAITITNNSAVSILITEGNKKYYLPVTIGSGSFSFSLPIRQYKITSKEFKLASNLEQYQFVTIDVPIDGKVSSLSVGITVPGDAIVKTWTEYNNLYLMSDTIEGYVSRRTADGITLFFGNGLIGAQPVAGSSVTVNINETEGISGNVAEGTINKGEKIYTYLDSGATQVVKYTATNSVAAFNGKEEEALEEIRSNSIKSITSLGNLVTNNDYKNINVVVDDSPLEPDTIAVLKRSDLRLNDIQLYSPVKFENVITPTRNEQRSQNYYGVPIPRGTVISSNGTDYYTLFDLDVNTDSSMVNYNYVMYEIEQIPSLIKDYETTYDFAVTNLIVSNSNNTSIFELYYTSTEVNCDLCSCEMQIASNERTYDMTIDSTSSIFTLNITPYTLLPADEQIYYFTITNPSGTAVSKYSATFTFIKDCSKFMLSSIGDYIDSTSVPGDPIIIDVDPEPPIVGPLYTWEITDDIYSFLNIIYNHIDGNTHITYEGNEGIYYIYGNNGVYSNPEFLFPDEDYSEEYCTMAYDSTGTMYFSGRTDDWELRYYKYGTQTEILDEGPLGSTFSVDMIIDDNDYVHIFYRKSNILYHTTNLSGAFVREVIYTHSDENPWGASVVAKIDRDQNYHIAVIIPAQYIPETHVYTSNIAYIYGNTGNWSSPDIVDIENRWVRVHMDIDKIEVGVVHISYYSHDDDHIRYTSNSSGTWEYTNIHTLPPVDLNNDWDIATNNVITQNNKVYIITCYRKYVWALDIYKSTIVISVKINNNWISYNLLEYTDKIIAFSSMATSLYHNLIYLVYKTTASGNIKSVTSGVYGESGWVDVTNDQFWEPTPLLDNTSWDSTSESWISNDLTNSIDLIPTGDWETDKTFSEARVLCNVESPPIVTASFKDINEQMIGETSAFSEETSSEASVTYYEAAPFAWVGTGTGYIDKINLDDDSIENILVGSNAENTFYDGEYMWVSCSDSFNPLIQKLHKYTNELLCTTLTSSGAYGTVLSKFPEQMCKASYLWFVCNTNDSGSYRVQRISLYNCYKYIGISEPTVGDYAKGIAYDGSSIWIAWSGVLGNFSQYGIHLESYGSFGIRSERLLFAGGYLWFSAYVAGEYRICKFDVSSKTVLDYAVIPDYTYDLAFDGVNVWTTIRNDAIAVKINASTMTIADNVAVGNDPRGITFDGSNILVCNYYDDTISRIAVLNGSGTTTITGITEEPCNIEISEPVIYPNPHPGSVQVGTTLALTCSILDYDIYYTIDGSDPNPGTLYTAPFTIPHGVVKVKAVGTYNGKIQLYNYTTYSPL